MDKDKQFAEAEAKLLNQAMDRAAESASETEAEVQPDARPKRLERHMVPQLLERYRTAMLILPKAHRRNNKDTESLAVERAQFEAERQALTDACALEDVNMAAPSARPTPSLPPMCHPPQVSARKLHPVRNQLASLVAREQRPHGRRAKTETRHRLLVCHRCAALPVGWVV
ncbi:hypothetical protein LA03_30745 [Burkholderia gladioli]|uniref:hypothetical protein n=1 Tax=Burkholderia gladioli TaxID=28095 RepID=UPI00050F65E2|nr:hypothetical protein [Burkholderia gladioli]KGE06727.1 hypothetical protein LA03_30745 [Burkholderia gladioli]